MKKLLALLLVLAMTFSLVACAESESASSSSKKNNKKDKTSQTRTEPTLDLSNTNTTTNDYTEDEEGAPSLAPQIIPSLPVNTYSLPEASITSFNGNISSEGYTNNYFYTPMRDGRYTFELSEVRADVVFTMEIYDYLGAKIGSSSYARNKSYVAVDLKGNEKYTVKISQHTNLGSYILSIGEQTATVDISSFSAINDSIKYPKQLNNYTFTPQLDGRYTFTLSEVKADIVLQIDVYDRLGERIGNRSYFTNNAYIMMDLKAGEEYTVVISYDKNYGSYTLNIGKQKTTVNLSMGEPVIDSTEFERQINIYTFTAQSNQHTLTFAEVAERIVLEVAVYNYLDERVAYRSYCQNETVVEMDNLTPGQVYTIKIYNNTSSGDPYGAYMLTVR